jgi:peptide deformylase
MAVLEIAQMGNPVLQRPAAAVEDPTSPEIAGLAADMLDTLKASGGVGLAAPQVSASLRLIVYTVPDHVPPTVLVNPQLYPLDDATEEGVEACLSAPGLMGPVPRWSRLRYRAQDLSGRIIEGVAEGYHARVLQHECDHLDGRLYLSRMTDIGRLAFTEEIRRQLAGMEKAQAEVEA